MSLAIPPLSAADDDRAELAAAALLPETHEDLECLVITHDEESLLERFLTTLPPERSDTWSIPQSRWDFAEPVTAETLERALRGLSINQVLLVGHSRGGTTAEPQTTRRPTPGKRPNPLEPVPARHGDARGVEHHVSEQLGRVMAICERIGTSENRDIRVDALLYRAEVDEFVAYDTDGERFTRTSSEAATI